jgi:hypothetical protein
MAISSSFFGPENVVTLSLFFHIVWVIPNFLSQSGRKIHPKKEKKRKKKPLSNEPTNTPLWMDVAWNGCKSEVNFIHWMASKMGKPGWCVFMGGEAPGSH